MPTINGDNFVICAIFFIILNLYAILKENHTPTNTW